MVKESACNAGDSGNMGLIPGLGRSPGEGSGNPLQYSSLENPKDRGAGQAPWSHKRVGPDLATKTTTTKDTIGENWGRGEWLRAGPGIFSQKQQLGWAPEVEEVAEGRDGEKYSRLRE